jgi:hypothetical protein
MKLRSKELGVRENTHVSVQYAQLFQSRPGLRTKDDRERYGPCDGTALMVPYKKLRCGPIS